MDLVTPGFGLIFWTVLVFVVLLILLRKYAWKPILKAVGEREKNIEESLNAAEGAKDKLVELKASNEKLLNEARVERDQILKEAREQRTNMIEEAKTEAKQEADKIVASAKRTIENEKSAAMNELKEHVATLSLEIAEKVLEGKLDTEEKQQELANKLAGEISLN